MPHDTCKDDEKALESINSTRVGQTSLLFDADPEQNAPGRFFSHRLQVDLCIDDFPPRWDRSHFTESLENEKEHSCRTRSFTRSIPHRSRRT